MTQPDKYFPPGAANYDSLSEFAGKTREDWEAENRALMTARFGDALAGVIILLEQIPIIGDIIEILTGVEDGDLNDLGTSANRFRNFLGSQWAGLLQAVEQGIGDAGKALGGIGDMIAAAGTALGGAVIGTAAAFGDAVGGVIQGLQQGWDSFWNGVFGVNQAGKTAADVKTAAGSLNSNVNTALTNAGSSLGQIGQMILAVPAAIGGGIVTTAAHLGDAIAGAIKGVQDTWDGFWNGVFGVDQRNKTATDLYNASNALLQRTLNALANSNTAIAVNYETASKGAAVLYSLRGGYTVDTITASGTWTKPTGLAEAFVALFAAGAKGENGSNPPFVGGPASGGGAGAAGKVIAAQLDPRTIPATVDCVIGLGTSTTPGATSFGSIVSTSDAFESYVSTPLGLMQTFAKASKGGAGSAAGSYTTLSYAQSGSTTQFGLVGGTGGANGFPGGGGLNIPVDGQPGNSGKAGLNFGLCQTGGSGGGGGGGGGLADGTRPTSTNGGNGGPGGAPGGGGGGGGGAATGNTPGTGGNGGNGLILVIYKLASDILPT